MALSDFPYRSIFGGRALIGGLGIVFGCSEYLNSRFKLLSLVSQGSTSSRSLTPVRRASISSRTVSSPGRSMTSRGMIAFGLARTVMVVGVRWFDLREVVRIATPGRLRVGCRRLLWRVVARR